MNQPGKPTLKTSCRIALLVIACCLAGRVQAAEETRPIRFAPLPMENRETLVKQFEPMLQFLEKHLQRPFEMVYSGSYEEIIEHFVAGTIDLAYLGPLPYVELRSRFPQAEPLVHFNEKSGRPKYTCAIVTMADSAIDLGSLSGRRIALTQPLSTCGYLSVSGMLREKGSDLEDNSYSYLDQHDTVALAVVRGEFAAGGLKTAIARKYSHLGLVIVAETPELPGFGLIANRATLSEDTLRALRESLTAAETTLTGKAARELWGDNIRHGAVAASDEDYEPVRMLQGDTVIPTRDKQ